uniref:Uncharacterized protein n=1 Tax=Podoviridae sp. cty7j44 TaxID=2826593 RepID=A0A8S5QZE9_9CAUD|nr:MAG TPA: hypothetical protein [Podoviridae sp. cty7j44]
MNKISPNFHLVFTIRLCFRAPFRARPCIILVFRRGAFRQTLQAVVQNLY